jgi:hypothetical protein
VVVLQCNEKVSEEGERERDERTDELEGGERGLEERRRRRRSSRLLRVV